MHRSADAVSPGSRPWLTTRLAHPVRDMDRSTGFYRDLLGLAPRGGFTGHAGYDGSFFILPGGAELELTVSATVPSPGTDEDLLVLYLPTQDDVARVGAELERAGVLRLQAGNPYWDRWGQTFVDPDGYLVVIAAPSAEPATADTVEIRPYTGSRRELRGLFELAEDSQEQLDSYLHTGQVLAATAGLEVVGHLQLVDTAHPDEAEIKNMAVREDLQGRGIGARLVGAAVDLATGQSRTTLRVGTAAADVGNLRFYQRQGFRMRAVERDAFTPAAGYPPGVQIAGIDLRDRVWLDRALGRPEPGTHPAAGTTNEETSP